MYRVLALSAIAAALVAGLVAGSAATGAPPSRASATGATFTAVQIRLAPQLVVRTDRVEIGYKARRGPNQGETVSAAGTLFVRNDLQASFTAVPLEIKKGLQARGLWATVPRSLVAGHRLFYYGVVRDLLSGRTVTIPAAGARAPESAWVVNHALVVPLGTIPYGHPKAPDAIVARAKPTQVAFGRDGIVYGPSSFQVAKDGSIWLFDSVKQRLLVWAPGHANTIARIVKVPGGTEFSLGPAGSIYVLHGPGRGNHITRLSASGKVLWTSRIGVGGGGELRTGPDGTLYWTGPMPELRDMSDWMPRWVPVATPDGRPLSLGAQWRGTRWTEPIARGLQLVASAADWETGPAPHEARFALVNAAGSVVRAWRVTSRTVIWWYPNKATPALVDGDPVIVLIAQWPNRPPGQQREYLVVRVGSKGELLTRFALPADKPPHSAYGDETMIATELRVEPGGVYQLGSAPSFGAAIYRYSLQAAR
jgi:hypothetical protein